MSNKIRVIIAVFCGVVLVLGIVCAVLVEDESLRIMLAVFGVLYVGYLIVLIKKLRSQPKNPAAKKSPLARK